MCLMIDTTSEKFELDQENEVDFDDPQSLKQVYHELFSNSSFLSKAYKNLQKYFKKLSKDHTELQKSFQDRADGSLEESTQTCDAYETLEIKETKLYLENETITKEKSSLLKNFQELENKLKALKKDLEELDELHDHQNEERCDFCKKVLKDVRGELSTKWSRNC